ncbi:SDR family oxidoreductase [Paenibacillus sp. TRM 82003]|uniref:SDR family oxidoreductase n=1 Tax=Kineococcus sp. TRM81007 TaxID=2925831 RepID=UPI001F594C41|nr:SDR family oxidoreductase [Kineococcus sp. TRM81007]MCI2237937.1 SDR family oxidoreductase [Kineococcus sp. TRM81007]MCI3925951.1 SDR family oxidoreductase [Paenibacillus sp. TRM 82003]
MTTWFISGASRGLGAEIARAALRGGDDVVATARTTDRLPADLTASEHLLPLRLDVTDQAGAPAAVDAAVERFGRIDVLVNNAGRGLLGAIEEVSDAEARSLFDLNVFGLLALTRAVLPVMRRQRSGTLVHIGSRSGFEGEPGVGLYSASKFAVAGISEALAAELAPFGIQSTVVEPGVFRTDFLDASSLSLPAGRIADYDGTPAHTTLDWSSQANHTQLGDPVKGAELIRDVVRSGALPSHLYLGKDSIERREALIERAHADIATWRSRSVATAHDDALASA